MVIGFPSGRRPNPNRAGDGPLESRPCGAVTAEAAGAVIVPGASRPGRERSTNMADNYAIVESGGKQYRAEKGSELVVDRLPADEGEKVVLRAVMFRGAGDVVLDGGDLEKVKVEATVAEHLRGEKVRVFKYRPKKGYRRRAGHRSQLTKLEVTEVKMLSRKPAAKAKDAPSAEAKKAGPKAEAKKASGKATAKKATSRRSSSTRKTSQPKKKEG
jgi:large subunit ribosomal protein L21